MNIFSGIDLTERGVNASWQRNSIILNNVANVDTPDFKASELQFETLFKSALDESSFQFKQTRAAHMNIGNSNLDGIDGVVVTSNTEERMDGNNVDIDKEMTDFAKNVIFYNALLTKVSGQFSQLRTAIKGQ
ncbi:flagellar basal body rod protein FlgB [Christensenellaceae bacterium OttesenSCG-928-K19]|nr:flagellar basal body rod protein FlgB [Christensenellaceae bacterium OttesenSCG-928-K19]